MLRISKLSCGTVVCVLLLANVIASYAQVSKTIVKEIVEEAKGNSQLDKLAHELLDVIGPRLVGTPQMKNANNWVAEKYKEWGINSSIEKWGEWRGWERGISHIDMVYPRVRSLEGTQLAWSPGTKGKSVIGELVIYPDLPDSVSLKSWLPNVKGKFVMFSMNQPTGRPDYNWEEFALPESLEKMRKERTEQTNAWRSRISKTGLNLKALALAFESAGALGVVTSNWSSGFGVNKIFGSHTTKIPSIDLSLEDYGMLYRLTESGHKPRISVRADSKDLGMVPAFNTFGEIRGTEKADEYVMLSAHLDSWDGATGATDNGTGTITMLEAMRILKKIYPNPKRTILAGHWSSEEQGLNGSRSFVEDHPEIVKNIQALFNQDNGTGRIVNITGQGFLHAYDYLGRWLSAVPEEIRNQITTVFPGIPGAGGSDYASFVAAGVPAFSLSSLNWSYGTYTWHTNRDTYDKIVFDDVRSNAILTAILVYMACEDPKRASNERTVLPMNPRTGRPDVWPAQKSPTRKGGN